MKKLVIILLLFFILSSGVNAICIFGLGNCNKFIIGFNPVFDEKEVNILQMLNLREVVEFKSKDIEREMPLKMIKPALPLIINTNVYDGEDFSVVIIKSGKILVLNLMNNYDILINGNEQELKDFFMSRTNQELVNKITQIDINPITFKGKLMVQIMENYVGVKIVKNKSTSQKAISVVTTPVIGIFKMFS